MKIITRPSVLVLSCACILVAAASRRAHADIVTYDFLGVVTSSNTSALSVGEPLVGQYFFNYGAVVLGNDTPESPPWGVDNPGETFSDLTPQAIAAESVFSQTVYADDFYYNTGEPGAGVTHYEGASGVYGTDTQLTAYDSFYMNAEGMPSDLLQSGISITNPAGEPPPYTSEGLPSTSLYSTITGYFEDVFGDDVSYSVVGMREVPIAAPEFDGSAAGTALTFLLGAGAVISGRRRRRS